MLLHYSRGFKADLKVLWCQAALGGFSLVSAQAQSSGSVRTPLYF